jgi:K+-sensing histidine kinase KdpD
MNTPSLRFRLKVVVAGVANLLALSYIHYISGYEFLFFVFYFIPAAMCGWYMGRLSIFCMSILTGVVWCFVDILTNHQYPHEVFRYANSVLCFIAFATIGLLVQGLRQSVGEHAATSRKLQKALDELKESTEQITKLQNSLQVVCAWTKRINVNGKWLSADEFLTEQLKAQVSYGVSPEAMKKVLQPDAALETA